MDANQHVNNVKYIGWILEVRIFDMKQIARNAIINYYICGKDSNTPLI